MPDTIVTVGSGQDYDTKYGLENALNAVPTDFSALTGNYIIEVYNDFVYEFTAGISKTITNESASKTLIVRPVSGEEHKGDFSSGVEILLNVAASTNYFQIECDYMEFKNFRFSTPSSHNYNIYIFKFNTAVTGVKLENLIWKNSSSEAPDRWMVWVNAAGTDFVFNNWIVDGNGKTNSYIIAIVNASSTGKINNCLLYDTEIGIYGGNAFWECNNTGSIAPTDGSGAGRHTLVSNFSGACNYDNIGAGQPTIGTNYLRSTLSNFKFVNLASDDYSLQRASTLINSGANVDAYNPNSITLEPFTSNHRSPFNFVVFLSKLLYMPRRVTRVYGQWLSGLVFSDVFNGNEFATYGNLIENRQIFSETEYSHNFFGLYRRQLDSRDLRVYDTQGIDRVLSFAGFVNLVSTSKFALIQDDSATPKFGIEFGRSADEIEVYIGSLVGTATLSNYVDTTDGFGVICILYIDGAVDAQRIKLYLWQKGSISEVTFSFTGSMGVTSLITSRQIRTLNIFEMSSIAVWDRKLIDFEIHAYLNDPYVMYRDPFRIEELILRGIIKGGGLWFLRKFIMEG